VWGQGEKQTNKKKKKNTWTDDRWCSFFFFFFFFSHLPYRHLTPHPSFCASAASWLRADPSNVVAVHCKAGKSRTGLMVCALLLHIGACATADDARALYNERRTTDGHGLNIGSQVRYVAYYERILCNQGVVPPPRCYFLMVLHFENVPATLRRFHTLVRSHDGVLFNSQTDPCSMTPVQTDTGCDFVVMLNLGVPVSGDFKLELWRDGKKRLFYAWLNTSFITCVEKENPKTRPFFFHHTFPLSPVKATKQLQPAHKKNCYSTHRVTRRITHPFSNPHIVLDRDGLDKFKEKATFPEQFRVHMKLVEDDVGGGGASAAPPPREQPRDGPSEIELYESDGDDEDDEEERRAVLAAAAQVQQQAAEGADTLSETAAAAAAAVAALEASNGEIRDVAAAEAGESAEPEPAAAAVAKSDDAEAETTTTTRAPDAHDSNPAGESAPTATGSTGPEVPSASRDA
jgi:hypothetical protein